MALRELDANSWLTVSAGNIPHGVAVDPKAQFVYVSNALSNNISGYLIILQVTLSPLLGLRSRRRNPHYCHSIGPGQFVYVPNLDSDTISAYSINPTTGGLSLVPAHPFHGSGSGPFYVQRTHR